MGGVKMPDNIKKLLEERQEVYGDSTANFKAIGLIWSQLLELDFPIDPYMVALMMIALKTWRAKCNPDHLDSWEDIIGYTTLGIETLK